MKQGNKMRIGTIVCWCIVAVAMAGLAVWIVTGSLFGLPTGFRLWGLSIGGIEHLRGEYELRDTRTVTVGGVDSLEIDWVAGTVTVTPYDGAEIEFKEYAQRELSGREQMYIETSNGTVSVRFIEERHISKMPSKRLEVLVPRELCERMEVFDADSTSAEISVTGVRAIKLTAGSTSGNIELADIRADDLSISTTSGEITVTRAVCGDMRLGSTSGNLKTTDTSADMLSTSTTSGEQRFHGEFKELDLDSTSGNLTVENGETALSLEMNTTSGGQTALGAYQAVYCDSVSGNVRITSAVVPDRLDIGTTSGDVTLTLPNLGGIALRHSTVSGSLKNDIPVTMGAGGSFEISTVSGDVRILAS